MRRRSVWRRTVSKECVLVAGGRGTGGVRGKAVRVRDTSRSQTSQERPPSIFQSQGAEWLLCTTKAQRQLVYRGRKENGSVRFWFHKDLGQVPYCVHRYT